MIGLLRYTFLQSFKNIIFRGLRATLNVYLCFMLILVYVCRCICGYLSGKPRVLVTHQLQYLKEADQLLVLSGVCILFHVQDLFKVPLRSNYQSI